MDADEKAVVDLTIAYAWALDTRQYDELRSVFATDATAMLRGVACDGVESIITRISRALSRLDATQHIVTNQHVRFDGDTGTCRTQLHAQHIKHGTEGGDTYVIGGFYEDRVERRPEGWRIVHRTLTETWAGGNPAVIAR
jgi:3-phenylpropionate/cinnamic acid dioxygenase small subunit